MSTFIVFGASGAVGGFLLPRLLAAGAVVHAISRQPSRPASEPRLHWLAGDLYATIAALPAQADAIVSLGPLDAFADWFAAHPVAGVGRVLALSSMSAESKRASPDPAERALAARLQAAEARLTRAAEQRGTAWTIFRPTLIYGSGTDRSLAPIARFVRRWHVLPIPFGASGLRQPVHAGDLADAVAAALGVRATYGKTYPLGGGERLPFDCMLLRLRTAAPGFVLPLRLPRSLIRAARRCGVGVPISPAGLRRLAEPLTADNADAARDFGYAPRRFIADDVLPEKPAPGS